MNSMKTIGFMVVAGITYGASFVIALWGTTKLVTKIDEHLEQRKLNHKPEPSTVQ